MQRINIHYCDTAIGELILGSYDNKLCLLDFKHRKTRNEIDNRLKKILNAEFVEQDDAIISQAKKQLYEYLNSNRKTFNLPILTVGSDFQKQVWKALQQVPYASKSSYLQIAKNINNQKAFRAVANASAANAIAIIVPCHRIIGSNGKLVGYAGTLKVKKHLLELEDKHLNS